LSQRKRRNPFAKRLKCRINFHADQGLSHAAPGRADNAFSQTWLIYRRFAFLVSRARAVTIPAGASRPPSRDIADIVAYALFSYVMTVLAGVVRR
jgi:hypothetical protein